MTDRTYILSQYSFDDGEAFYYVLNTPENIEYIKLFEKKDNNRRFYVLENDTFSESSVDNVVFSSGLNKLNCGSVFYKCNTIEDLEKGYIRL